MKIYLAGPLFSIAEQQFNRELAQALTRSLPDATVILPQERAKPLLGLPNGLSLVYQDCLEMVAASDIVIAILEGADADSGTCVELGYAVACRKPILGVRTDFRASEDAGLNLMVSHACTRLVRGTFDTLEILVTEIAQQLRIMVGRTPQV